MENNSNEILKLFRKFNPSIIDYHPVVEGVYSLEIGYATIEENQVRVNGVTENKKHIAIRTAGYMLARISSKGEPILISPITFNAIGKSANGNIMCAKNLGKKDMVFYFDKFGKRYTFDRKHKFNNVEAN